jgi:hypothetical protein
VALLKDKRDHYSLTLEPITPSPNGLRNAYSVIVKRKADTIFERCYTTWPETPDGHWQVWRLFRACQLAAQLMSSQTPFNISASGQSEFNEDPLLNVNTGWLDLILSGDVIVHRYGRPEPWREERCHVKLYLLETPQEMTEGDAAYRCFSLTCRSDDVVCFGQELEAECREAVRLRRELGVTAPADDYIDD